MKTVLCLLALVTLAISAEAEDPVLVQCYDQCSELSVFSAGGADYIAMVPAEEKKCSKDSVKKCEAGQVCVSFDIDATSKVTMGEAAAVVGALKTTISFCGASDPDITSEMCVGYGVEIQKEFDAQPAEAGFTVSDVVTTCGETSDCSEDCVDEEDKLAGALTASLSAVLLTLTLLVAAN